MKYPMDFIAEKYKELLFRVEVCKQKTVMQLFIMIREFRELLIGKMT